MKDLGNYNAVDEHYDIGDDLGIATITALFGIVGIPCTKLFGASSLGNDKYSITRKNFRDGLYLSSVVSGLYETASLPFWYANNLIRNLLENRDMERRYLKR